MRKKSQGEENANIQGFCFPLAKLLGGMKKQNVDHYKGLPGFAGLIHERLRKLTRPSALEKLENYFCVKIPGMP